MQKWVWWRLGEEIESQGLIRLVTERVPTAEEHDKSDPLEVPSGFGADLPPVELLGQKQSGVASTLQK